MRPLTTENLKPQTLRDNIGPTHTRAGVQKPHFCNVDPLAFSLDLHHKWRQTPVCFNEHGGVSATVGEEVVGSNPIEYPGWTRVPSKSPIEVL